MSEGWDSGVGFDAETGSADVSVPNLSRNLPRSSLVKTRFAFTGFEGSVSANPELSARRKISRLVPLSMVFILAPIMIPLAKANYSNRGLV
jgi:hypothetical protein